MGNKNNAEMRPPVDLTNEAQNVETCEVSLARAERKTMVDHPDPVWHFHYISCKTPTRSSYTPEINMKRF